MSYTKPCNKCGQRISLRQMPAGQWVAFDVSTEESHVCGVQNEPSVAVKLKKNKRQKIDDETEDFGIKIDDINDDIEEEIEEDIEENIEEVKTYDSVSGIHKCIDKAIKEKKRIFIEYNSEHNEEITEREISPFKKFKEKGRTYLQAYCHKRKNERIFLTRSIALASEVNKARTKVKLGKPSLKIIKKLENDYTYENSNISEEKPLTKKTNQKREKKIYETPSQNNFSIGDAIEDLFETLVPIGIIGFFIYIFFF